MRSETPKVFLACALGAFIGSLVALNLSHSFWWVGLIVGGLVGYLSYEFKTAVAAVPKAWTAAVTWRPNRYWSIVGELVLPAIGVVATCAICLVAIMCAVSEATYAKAVSSLPYISVISALWGIMLALRMAYDDRYHNHDIVLRDKKALIALSPFRVYLWLPIKLLYATPVFFWKNRLEIKGIAVEIAATIGWFLKQLLILIHSEIRLLCMTDAAIGVAIGYFCHSVLIGGLAGGFIGVLNFELFSIRILKLVPAERSIFSR